MHPKAPMFTTLVDTTQTKEFVFRSCLAGDKNVFFPNKAMLIPFVEFCRHYSLAVTGVIHVGAHDCEEFDVYEQLVSKDNVYWFEAQQTKVDQVKRARPYVHIY
jgi:hypothetical protein